LILYADSSCLVKLYLSEDGSAEMRQVSFAADEVACTRVGYAETRVALARALRDKRMTESEFRSARRKFELEWPDLAVVEVSKDIVRLAADLGDQYPIRAFDAVHLASAIEIRSQPAGPEVSFASADRRLRGAAVAENFILAFP
jgi:predicted nucleic acid-binding protein